MTALPSLRMGSPSVGRYRIYLGVEIWICSTSLHCLLGIEVVLIFVVSIRWPSQRIAVSLHQQNNTRIGCVAK